jgi:hypothetical protein
MSLLRIVPPWFFDPSLFSLPIMRREKREGCVAIGRAA